MIRTLPDERNEERFSKPIVLSCTHFRCRVETVTFVFSIATSCFYIHNTPQHYSSYILYSMNSSACNLDNSIKALPVEKPES